MPVRNFRKASMKRSSFWGVRLFIPLLLASTAAFAQAERPFALFIRTQEPTTKAGSEVNIWVTLENTSPHEIGILKSAPELNYSVEMRDLSGKAVPDTEYGRKLKAAETVGISTSSVIIPLKPNEIIEDQITVSKLYEMAQPGKYMVRVLRVIPPDLGTGAVSSNTITVVVTP